MQNQAHGVIQPMVIFMAVALVTPQRVGQSLSGSVRGSSRKTPCGSQCEGTQVGSNGWHSTPSGCGCIQFHILTEGFFSFCLGFF